MKILVIGGTGNVGSQVVRNLLDRKADTRIMTHTKEKLSNLPAGTEGVLGDLGDKTSLREPFAGVDRVFLMTPLSPKERELGLNGVQAAKEAGVKRVVYMSVHRLEDIPDAPHFADKIPIENAVKESGIPYTLIRPNNFFQNDYWFKQPIMEYGIYAQPYGNKGLHRVDTRDIADAITNALLNDGFTGKTYNLVGPDLITADATAQTYGKHLAKTVVYAGDDLNKWAESALKMLPDWLVKDFAIMYRHFQTHGLIATPEQNAETLRILGKRARTFEAFVAETTMMWKQEAMAGVKAKV